jgi:WD40 repeat protein
MHDISDPGFALATICQQGGTVSNIVVISSTCAWSGQVPLLCLYRMTARWELLSRSCRAVSGVCCTGTRHKWPFSRETRGDSELVSLSPYVFFSLTIWGLQCRAVTGSSDGTIRVWSLAGRELQLSAVHAMVIQAIRSVGDHIVSCGADGSIGSWHAAEGFTQGVRACEGNLSGIPGCCPQWMC